jgi:S-adenosylmethionine synthetase
VRRALCADLWGRSGSSAHQHLFGGPSGGRDRGKTVPIDEIAVEGSRAWLRANIHALDAARHVEIHNLVRPGSQELQKLFLRRPGSDARLANDTSIGIGYAPLSALERLVLMLEKTLAARDKRRPARGEDVKIMGVRRGSAVKLTIAVAIIARYLRHIDDYLNEKAAVEDLARNLAIKHGFSRCQADVNVADDPQEGAIYLTVTGTSAESGDDGEVGRGNRVNGLITPNQPMVMEAAAGKNPETHVGKIYGVLARDIAETLVAQEPGIVAA